MSGHGPFCILLPQGTEPEIAGGSIIQVTRGEVEVRCTARDIVKTFLKNEDPVPFEMVHVSLVKWRGPTTGKL